MCYEEFSRRRRLEREESRELWEDFERTQPKVDPQPRPEMIEAERADAREEVSAPER